MEGQRLVAVPSCGEVQGHLSFMAYLQSRGMIDGVNLPTAVAVCIGVCGVIVLYYFHRQQCKTKNFGRTAEHFPSIGNADNSEHKSVRRIQALARSFLERQRRRKRNRAILVSPSKLRGIVLRSILEEEEEEQEFVAASKSDNTVENRNEDCRRLIESFQSDQSQANFDTIQDESVRIFGFQVKEVLEVRLRVLATVVLQSWLRMVRCRIRYRKYFSSLTTPPIRNMPSIRTSRLQSALASGSSFSSLSSWSSTWNRIQTSKLGASSSYVLSISSTSGSSDPMVFRASNEEKLALKESINSYAAASSIVQLQAWWRASLVKVRLQRATSYKSNEMENCMSDGAASRPVAGPPPDSGRRRKQAASESQNTERTSNISCWRYADEPRICPPRKVGEKHRMRRTNDYYQNLWKSTLEQLGEFHTMCNAAIDSTDSMDCSQRQGEFFDMARTCEDSNEAMLTRIARSDMEIPECTKIPSMLAEETRKRIDDGGCAWFTEDELVISTRKNAMELIERISALRNPTRRRPASARYGQDSSLYYSPTDMELLDVEPLSMTSSGVSSIPSVTASTTTHTGTATASSPTSYTFASPSSHTFFRTEKEETSYECSAHHRNRGGRMNCASCATPTKKKLGSRMNCIFCTAPTSTSNTYDTESIWTCENASYYSFDDFEVSGDLDDRDDDDSGVRLAPGDTTREPRRAKHR